MKYTRIIKSLIPWTWNSWTLSRNYCKESAKRVAMQKKIINDNKKCRKTFPQTIIRHKWMCEWTNGFCKDVTLYDTNCPLIVNEWKKCKRDMTLYKRTSQLEVKSDRKKEVEIFLNKIKKILWEKWLWIILCIMTFYRLICMKHVWWLILEFWFE